MLCWKEPEKKPNVPTTAKQLSITDFQWDQIKKALKKRLQWLRQRERRYGYDKETQEKMIAIKAIFDEWNEIRNHT